MLTSADGLTWSSQTVAQGIWLVSIAYGGGNWVAVGAAGTILVSPDLKTWVSATAVTQNRLNGVLYNGSVWIAVGEAGTIVTSPDALSWTVQPIPAALGITGFLHGVTWDQVSSVFLITGQATATQPIDTKGQGVMLRLPVTGTSIGTVSTTIPDTTSPLEAVLFESSLNPNTVAVGGGGLIISGSYGATAPVVSAVPDANYRGLAYGNGYWVAAGDQATILSSANGVDWTQRFTGNSPATLVSPSVPLLSAAYSEMLQRFVVTGVGGTILASNSAPTVFANVSTRGFVNSNVTGGLLDGGFVIEGTAPRTILIRADGPVLGAFGVSNPLPDPVLTVYNSSGTVVATNTGWTTNTNPAALVTAAIYRAFALPNPVRIRPCC